MMIKENRANAELIETFSRRELQILDLLVQDYTNQEIAVQLSLAVNSVKWYLQQIFGKLTVKNRREAIRRAKESGLLNKQTRVQALQPPPNNLPKALTTFIGRQKEIDEIRRLFTHSGARLVTLTGTGGVGKTRLAIRAAENSLWEFNDGVWMVDLAPLGDAALLPHAVATVFGFQSGADSPIEEVMIANLRVKKSLLILDNCEHMVKACAPLVEKLLHACPGLGVLASSREGLGIPGEVIYTVSSLSVPTADWQALASELLQYEAVRLFIDRAQLVLPAFELTAENAQAIVQICRRLDGIPLAIELAAARVKLLPVDQLAARLEKSFRLLAGGSRTALPRHQTVRASIEWSFAMLTQPEQALLRRLAVFRGGWTLSAAESVVEGFSTGPNSGRPAGEASEPDEILDGLAQLVNKSLVVINQQAGSEPRYRMIETVRQYAFEKLIETDETTQARDGHLMYFVQHCEALEPLLRSAKRLYCLDQVESDLDNIRDAWAWALDSGQAELALRLISTHPLLYFFRIRGHGLLNEGRQWLERARSGFSWDSPRLTRLHARVLYADISLFTGLDWNSSSSHNSWNECANLFQSLGDETNHFLAIAEYGYLTNWFQVGSEEHQRLLLEGYQIGIRLDDPWMKAMALMLYAKTTMPQNCQDMLRQSIRLFEENGDRWFAGMAILALGLVAFGQKDYATAEDSYLQSLQINQEIKNKEGIMWALTNLGDLAYFRGDFARMENYFYQCQIACQEIGFITGVAWSIHHRGLAAHRLDQISKTVALYTESLRLAQAYNIKIIVRECLLGFAVLCAETDQWQPAIILLECAKRTEECDELTNTGVLTAAEYDRINQLFPARLTPAEYEAACTTGKALSYEEAIQFIQPLKFPSATRAQQH